ncbi:AMP-binding protein [Azospirillum picis]|uniref:Acyl-coenzyme A synthetase/AMP-(Fatty) acid ligase n=1 Tax=Azospirillum picis TaxID=488438 RepID=A0ABU0MQC7_9PROT|nr:AMP-binding protein [Azospirillum picis]MBP2302027.1 acyl-coenzyme A synthetase/AMP-(fatty) acid ligase [Azospirillum picis]MDQ0535682.1 acyl-coenzyme A synthetase/AMP-(fatty) acid ligase [Azospirillum picis]
MTMLSTTRLPLIRHRGPDDLFAWHDGAAVKVRDFLAAVHGLALRLPERAHVLNLCADRLGFTIGLGAALLRRQISLLPPSDTPATLHQIKESYPDLVCLTDAGVHYPGFDQVEALPSGGLAGLERAGLASGDDALAFPADQVAAIAFTSGSTGRPMPQVKSWGTLVRSVRGAGKVLGLAAMQGAGLVGTVPHQHMYGLESVALLSLQHGLVMHARRPLFPADIAAGLAVFPERRILVTTPVHLQALLADGSALPPIDLILCATAPLAPQLAADAEARMGAPLHEIYGCSETGQLALRRTSATAEWLCIDGIHLRQDEQGTWASGEFLDGETLLADVIELKSDTRFILHGRSADQVNIAGKRSSLAYLNHHLNSIEGVRDGVFFMPRDDGARTTRLAALVVAPDLDTETLLGRLRERIDPIFLPRPLRFVDALPRNPTGKLPREALLRLLHDTRQD